MVTVGVGLYGTPRISYKHNKNLVAQVSMFPAYSWGFLLPKQVEPLNSGL